ncbi:hypothetical protein DY000_02042479 [Brassica cretica]|uniref:Uncharacterized protein n=1 Tax=Brassica cretica TaxID=69181 RepID=A0ABQ7BDK3_BRACR|nr:hypothetical protein DY000_02042479 [Brassica cretica]
MKEDGVSLSVGFLHQGNRRPLSRSGYLRRRPNGESLSATPPNRKVRELLLTTTRMLGRHEAAGTLNLCVSSSRITNFASKPSLDAPKSPFEISIT